MSTPEQWLEAITPEALERAVRALVAEREPTDRAAVAIGTVARRLVADGVLEVDLNDSLVAEQVARQIEKQVAFVEGMTYIENE